MLYPQTAISENCPQERNTPTAPELFLSLKNPLTPDHLTIKAEVTLIRIGASIAMELTEMENRTPVSKVLRLLEILLAQKPCRTCLTGN